ncbi:hypothetical protein A11A3_13860 [Alcanivorax hongdengensis A-11-3]|uniref:DUF4440 domain-containing protein n=1 Tax=Alcanivorax hongdengensis A-11-3 TaxID=1177179 RepID=L0W9N0_9GAMM|nr:hypothetical protein [Alcanivorax hongdengensis]EKF73443.1 hypothetical protein A11A3_13860 [Alcanivorax hongdengensis A-11-3]
MNHDADEIETAETFLTEMLEADRVGHYSSFIQHFDPAELEGFDEKAFLDDVALMRDELGAYQSRHFLGSLQGFQHEDRPQSRRFVWRAVYEKNEALIILGMHRKDGEWVVNESVVSK